MVLQSRRVWLAGQFVPAQLEVADGKIVNVYPFGTKTADVDYGNKRIVPGFIDVHTHGAYGFDTNDGEPEGLRDWMRRIPGWMWMRSEPSPTGSDFIRSVARGAC